jgi:phosphoglycolate phosphatase
MRYRLVIFDFDGTLADSFPWFLRTLESVSERFSLAAVSPGDIADLRHKSTREIIASLAIPTWKLPLLARHLRERAQREYAEIQLFAGVELMLSMLATHGVKLALASSNREVTVRAVLGEKCAAHFDQFACGASLFGEAALFRRLLRKANVDVHDTLCIGDEVRDAEAARAAGIRFAAVSWGFNSIEALQRESPHAVFYETADIIDEVLPSLGRLHNTTSCAST